MNRRRSTGLLTAACALILSLLTAGSPQAPTEDGDSQADPMVAGTPVPAAQREPGAEDMTRPLTRRTSVYPVAGRNRVSLPRVDATGTTEVTVETLDPENVARLGGTGLGVRVWRVDDRRSAEKVRLEMNYSGFANAHGGGFAGRLRVVRMPEREWVPARNDLSRQRLVVEVTPGPASEPAPVLMLATAAGGSFSGNFGATDLAPTGSWQTGLSSGSFTYSYPVPVPASPQGKGPELAFRYNSSAVDGMTAATNAQAGWTGLGWQLGSDYIERRYKPCAEDATGPGKKSKQKNWGHFCWESPDENDGQAETTDPTNSDLYLSLGGRSSRIVKDRLTGTWKTEEDYGWKIVHVDGGAGGQPYWLVTTQAGDVHRFGFERNSMWQIPYAGDDPGEPCNDQYANGGRDYPGMCFAPWRWNLDQIVDANENLTTYHWKRESGKYLYYETGSCCTDPPTSVYTPIDYDRGGYLDRIEWGSNTSIAASRPTTKIAFNMVSRCSSTTERDDPLASPYPIDTGTGNLMCGGSWDVPDDLVRCETYQCNNGSPAFFIMRRLDSVVTYALDGATGAWDDVHKLQLRFKYVRSPEAGSNGCCTPTLWLDYIRPVGLIGSGEVRLPPVDFDAIELNGRVDWGADFFLIKPKAILPRIATVHNGYGGRIEVTYGRPNACPDGGAEADGYSDWYNALRWDRNNQDCFRTYDFWMPFGGGPEVMWGVYHKYHVTRVVERDTVAASPDVVTSYDYQGRPAWAFPVNYLGTKLTVPTSGGTAQLETASWSEARGYETVRTLKGSGTDPAGYTVTTDTFFRGMFDDVYADGTRKQLRLTDFDGGVWDDLAVFAGRSLQKTQWNMTSYSPRQYAETESTRHEFARVTTGDGPGVLDPGRVDDVRTRGRQALNAGGFRYTDLRTTYDTYGLPTRRNDYGVDGLATDNTCTTTRYARNTTQWLISFPVVIEERTGDTCTAGAITGRTELAYDNATQPADGNATQERRWVDASRIAVTRTAFDDYGRVVSVTDPVGKITTTTYNPPVGFPDAGVTTTNPANHETTTWSSRAHGQPVRIRDAQGRMTELDYDPLGRATAAWGPGEPRGGGTPSSRMSYTLAYNGSTGQPTAPVRTLTEKLLSGTGASARWQASYAYDDGFGRIREAQTPSPAGGRIVVASQYDGRGQLAVNTSPMHNAAAPGAGLLNPARAAIPIATRYVRDGAERTTAAVHTTNGVDQRQVRATYAGEDLVTVSPPTGGSTEYWFDREERVVRVVEAVQPGVSRQTRYEYDTDGNVTKIIDARGNVRTFQYDWQGRVVAVTDPDSGSNTKSYDLAGRLTSTVDGRGQKISYGYDDLGRKTSQWAGEQDTGTKLAEWTYDNVADGQLDSATRWVGSDAYRYEITGYDADNRPTATRITIPAAEGALAGTYSFTAAYNRAGQRTEIGMPAVGGLPAEKVTTTYNDQGQANALTSNLAGTVYVKDTTYTGTGKLSQRSYGALGHISRRLTWDPATDRLANVTTLTKADTTAPVTVQDDSFSYDNSDNVIRVADKTAIVDGQLGVQSECFTYDTGNRLTFAWTTTKPDCSAGPQNSPDGKGPDPYRQTFTYDEIGNIASVETDGRRGSYAYPATGSARPNAVTAVTYPDRTDSYRYNDPGQMTSRTVAGTTTDLSWDEEGRLRRSTTAGQSTEYLYQADGERLVRREPGSTTVYLGDMELRAAGTSVTATRYYVAGDGAVVAVRSERGLTWLAADPQRSEQLAIDDDTGRVDRQRYLPFGGHRGGRDDITATDRGFLGKTEDADTGLSLLSARYYDPSVGRFISPDPALDLRNPQWMNSYAYAGNNPVSRTDPSGLASCSSTKKSTCMPDADALRGKQKDLAKTREQCWYQGKNCDKLPKAERVPPWKRTTPKATTVEDALYAAADGAAKTAIGKARFKMCLATVPDVGGRCAKVEEEISKAFNRAYVAAFCGQHKALCAAAAPDYLTLSVSFGIKGQHIAIAVTVTRTGQVYASGERGMSAGVDIGGFGFAVKVGWVYDRNQRRATSADVSSFPEGAAGSASVSLGRSAFLGIAVTQTHHAIEYGTSPPGVSFGIGYGLLVDKLGPLWSI
ncbi:RHS repeat-associated core domain-containing protein [Plantactinospora endophytica]|uniref:Type IV secretion protein Rhs n=1 Tax=Plantactinospora endophytica TaxID=673535 RepID=A0ABQ4EE93_9ACTN|nr:RHS repeat-associated core domain-containing protein [Plantactinospora endophytica]GIG93041.1 type IV secretion protein Rhs [Plantactinospora endophytica]